MWRCEDVTRGDVVLLLVAILVTDKLFADPADDLGIFACQASTAEKVPYTGHPVIVVGFLKEIDLC